MSFLKMKRRRDPIFLQLTALIDVFSMIVIFLVVGSVSGTTEIKLPGGLTLPESISKESPESGPQLIVGTDEVQFLPLQLNLQMKLFEASENETKVNELKVQLKAYSEKLASTNKDSSVLLNIVADEKLPYNKLYNVLSVFRQSGFETLLFVTRPKKGGST